MLTGSIIGDIKYQFRNGNMVTKIILANVGVFIIFGLFYLIGFLTQSQLTYTLLTAKFEVPASFQTLITQPWSAFTYMFLHESVWHILFNMLWLYWFGEIFVLFLGDKKVLPLYILGGLVGALFYMLAFNFIPVFKPSLAASHMLGASASIFAIVFAAATISPDYEIGIILIGPVKIKYIAIVTLLLDIITIPYGNAGGYISHVGGALMGYTYIKALQSGFDFAAPFNKLFDAVAGIFKPRSKVKVTYKNTSYQNAEQPRKQGEQEKVDDILDKIARSGYESLSKEEKDFLFHFSKK